MYMHQLLRQSINLVIFYLTLYNNLIIFQAHYMNSCIDLNEVYIIMLYCKMIFNHLSVFIIAGGKKTKSLNWLMMNIPFHDFYQLHLSFE